MPYKFISTRLIILIVYFSWLDSPGGHRPFFCRVFQIKLRHTKLDRTLLD